MADGDSGAARTGTAPPRFGLMLVIILVVYTVVIAFGGSRVAGPLRVGLLGLLFALTARLRTGSAGRTRTTAAAVVAAALLVGVVAALSGRARLSIGTTSAVVVLLVLASIAAIARFLWHRPVVDAQSVSGALAVYLLLAMLFATVHQLLAALLGQPYLTGVSSIGDTAGYLYFSTITLATVGYGDITPACPAARAVAMSESLVGQLYLVAVVGNWTGPRRPERRGGEPERPGGGPERPGGGPERPGGGPGEPDPPDQPVSRPPRGTR
jgi:hypothetical protein